MQEIDLGEELKFKVKYKGQEFVLREPTVQEIEQFKSSEGTDSVQFLSQFLEALGMPPGLTPQLGVSKAKALLESVVEMLVKKK